MRQVLFTSGTRRRDELAIAHRERLRAQHARAPWPVGERDDDRDGERGTVEVFDRYNRQRKCRERPERRW